MTGDALQAIEERANAATIGPWRWWGTAGRYALCNLDRTRYREVLAAKGGAQELMVSDKDADFIIHARDDIPELIAEVKRLQEEVSSLRAEQPENLFPGDALWEPASELYRW